MGVPVDMSSDSPIGSRFREPQESGARSGGCARALIAFALLAGLPAASYFAWLTLFDDGLDPVGPLGPIVYVPGDGGGNVYLLSGQWKTTFTTGRTVGSNRTYRTDLLIDLWAFRAGDMSPLWRRRLETERGGAMSDRWILGEHDGTIWLLMNGRIEALSRVTGDRLAGPEEIEEINPELRGLLPTEVRFCAFDDNGLRITAADGHIWRLAGDSLKASPDFPAEAPPGTANPPAQTFPAATYMYQQRGLDIPGFWLGLLTESETPGFEKNNTIGGMDLETRRRLWRARAVTAENFFGEYLDYTELAALPNAPDFLGAGLLSEYQNGQPTGVIWLRDPDSVAVLHVDRLGEEGKLHLTRIAGPEGHVLWDTALPLSVLQSLIRTPEGVVLLGYEIQPAPDNRPRDPSHDALARLVSVNLANGALYTFSAEDYAEHPEAVPAEPAP